jgi:hypothetical protein
MTEQPAREKKAQVIVKSGGRSPTRYPFAQEAYRALTTSAGPSSRKKVSTTGGSSCLSQARKRFGRGVGCDGCGIARLFLSILAPLQIVIVA